jgi:PAS domain S-box-containing protein
MVVGKKKPGTTGIGLSLRDDAEEQLARSPKHSPDLEGQTPEQLIHELRVHQIELETQADELRRVNLALVESRDKYLDLYDFAPVGYITLNDRALITEVNLCGAKTLLGVPREDLVNHGLGRFIAPGYPEIWDQYFIKVLKLGDKQICTLMLQRGDGSVFPARLESVRITGCNVATTVRMAISDISDVRRAEEALKESRQRITFSLESAELGAWELDLVTHKAWRSLRHDQIFGYEELLPEWTYEMFLDHVVPEDRPIVDTKFGKALENCSAWDFECRIQRKDGAICWIWAKGRPEYNDLHEPVKMYGIVQDITGRKRADEEIKLSFERFKTILDGLDALVYVIDVETFELLFINKYGKNTWGEIEGQTCWKTIQSGQKGPCPFCTNDRLIGRDGNPTGVYQWEFQNTKTGKWYDCRDSAIRWLDGRIVRLEIATDITGRKKVEEALQESEERFRDLFNKANDAIYLYEYKPGQQYGHIIEANEVACRMLQYSHDELLHMRIDQIRVPDELESVRVRMNQHSMERRRTFETRHRRRDGTCIPIEENSDFFVLKGRKVVLAIARDITERKKTEEKVRKSLVQIESDLEQMALFNDQIRNPVAVIIGLLERETESKTNTVIREQAYKINALVTTLDHQYRDSEKVREFLRKHYDFYQGRNL